MLAPVRLYSPTDSYPCPRVGGRSEPESAVDPVALRALVQAALAYEPAPCTDPERLDEGHAALAAAIAAGDVGSRQLARAVASVVDEQRQAAIVACEEAGMPMPDTPAIVERIEAVTQLAALTLLHAPGPALAAVRRARQAGTDAVADAVARAQMDIVLHSSEVLRHVAARAEVAESEHVFSEVDEKFWARVGEANLETDAAAPPVVPRTASGKLVFPVGRAEAAGGWPCPTCQSSAVPLRRCDCGLQTFCSSVCATASFWHSCAERRATAARLADKLLADGGIVIVALTEGVALPLRANCALRNLLCPCWFPTLTIDDLPALYQCHALVIDALDARRLEGALPPARRVARPDA